jgi:hypothetical protein
MLWTRVSAYCETTYSGYTVTAYRTADSWRFGAWCPDAAPGWSYHAFAKGQEPHWAGERHKERYGLGEHVPQRFELLGHCDTAEGARALCEADAARSTNHDTMGVQQCLTTRR